MKPLLLPLAPAIVLTLACGGGGLGAPDSPLGTIDDAELHARLSAAGWSPTCSAEPILEMVLCTATRGPLSTDVTITRIHDDLDQARADAETDAARGLVTEIDGSWRLEVEVQDGEATRELGTSLFSSPTALAELDDDNLRTRLGGAGWTLDRCELFDGIRECIGSDPAGRKAILFLEGSEEYAAAQWTVQAGAPFIVQDPWGMVGVHVNDPAEARAVVEAVTP